MIENTITKLMEELDNSADNAGCSGGLTVVSDNALMKLSAALISLYGGKATRTQAAIMTLLESLLDSADHTGCSSDLTVVSDDALQALFMGVKVFYSQNLAPALAPREDDALVPGRISG